ncbi:MAG: hypothetical protein R3B89_28420 [Polyangiaceae bacterium]
MSFQVDAAKLVGVDARGLWVRAKTSATVPAFLVGTAVWVDAKGKRTVIRPVFDHGRVTYVVPQKVLAESAYPALLDPVISQEFEPEGLVDPSG